MRHYHLLAVTEITPLVIVALCLAALAMVFLLIAKKIAGVIMRRKFPAGTVPLSETQQDEAKEAGATEQELAEATRNLYDMKLLNYTFIFKGAAALLALAACALAIFS